VEWMYQMYSTNNEYLVPNQVTPRPLAKPYILHPTSYTLHKYLVPNQVTPRPLSHEQDEFHRERSSGSLGVHSRVVSALSAARAVD
jgi:hypothetical protein